MKVSLKGLFRKTEEQELFNHRETQRTQREGYFSLGGRYRPMKIGLCLRHKPNSLHDGV
jgi:hypothetical protein